jgi:hypothetical protein
MRSRQLETALTEFVGEAADRLQAEVEAGAEVGFELAEKPARRGESAARLYCYRALTDEFIEQRAAKLASLPAHAEATKLLVGFEGLNRYLTAMGGGGELGAMKSYQRAGAALRLLLEDVFAEQTSFDRRSDVTQYEQRLQAALTRLECSTQASTSEMTLLATLHGLTLASEELALTKGLTIARPGALRGVPDAAEGDHLFVLFTAEDGDEDTVARGREVLKDLLRALRLFGDGRVTLGALAWARVGTGSWNPVALGAGGRPHGMLVVSADQEDELRAFCNLVSRRAPHGNELAWALRRFELGCEHASAYEALSDHLLGLRALLEPEGPASGLLAARVAALCAMPEDRERLRNRMIDAQALERATIAGTASEHAAGMNLAGDVADHLRALLRDVICGHLESNLALVADELMAQDVEERRVEAQQVEEQRAEEQRIEEQRIEAQWVEESGVEARRVEEQPALEQEAPLAYAAAASGVDPRDAGHERYAEFDEDPLEQLAQHVMPI